jgi:hypothetical protein
MIPSLNLANYLNLSIDAVASRRNLYDPGCKCSTPNTAHANVPQDTSQKKYKNAIQCGVYEMEQRPSNAVKSNKIPSSNT